MEYLTIKHFKCFIDAEIELNSLSVFCGANSHGKSSSIQCLLLLRSYIEANLVFTSVTKSYSPSQYTLSNLPLNGPYLLSLGMSSHVINNNVDDNSIIINLEANGLEINLELLADSTQAQLWLTPKSFSIQGESVFIHPILKKSFYYLNAERIGPRIQQVMNHSNFPSAGWKGEDTAQLLNLESGYWKVSEKRMFGSIKSSYLKDQINGWLEFIMPGVKVKVKSDPDSLITQILLENAFTVNEPNLATNLGFGISYLLPILANGLVADKGSYFIVENPEAHLHPSAQSRVGQFLAKVAADGVKVVIETHSDHIINGIQIAAASNVIDSESVTINYFGHNDSIPQPLIEKISINNKGELSEWPAGFFDQSQVDFLQLMRLRGKNIESVSKANIKHE